MTQPTPTTAPESRPVFPMVMEFLESRRQKGIATYGTELMTQNGRDVRQDLLEELADALQYAIQDAMEQRAAKDMMVCKLRELIADASEHLTNDDLAPFRATLAAVEYWQ